jgi:predicted membrane protein
MDRYDRARWGPRASGGLVGGIILAGIGVLLLLQNLGIPFFDNLERYWPVILIVVGVVHAARSWGMGGRIWGAIVFGVGVIFLLSNFNVIHDAGRFIFPGVLIIVGLAMLAKAIDRNTTSREGFNPGATASNARAMGEKIRDRILRDVGAPPASGPIPGSSPLSADHINEWAFFGGTRRRVDSKNFQGGDAFSMFGGVVVDLRSADSTREEMLIEANAIFGGVELRVPETWNVTVRGAGIFGGYEDKTLDARVAQDSKAPHLVVSGIAMFGGVTVRN